MTPEQEKIRAHIGHAPKPVVGFLYLDGQRCKITARRSDGAYDTWERDDGMVMTRLEGTPGELYEVEGDTWHRMLGANERVIVLGDADAWIIDIADVERVERREAWEREEQEEQEPPNFDAAALSEATRAFRAHAFPDERLRERWAAEETERMRELRREQYHDENDAGIL